MDPMSTLTPNSSSTEIKNAVMQTVKSENIMNNGRDLVENIKSHCFENCVPTPGSSLSNKETSCYTMCMGKYMQAFNVVGMQFRTRMQQDIANFRP
ncbi:MAG: protein translocase subunit [Cirrosporium novae-zelandiae]|nr:MAG: protein translocase subunit [Cirrosporium novae-zelandiae]